MSTVIKHSVPDRVKPSFVIFDIRALRRLALSVSAQMSKITNDGLTRSGTGRFIAVPTWQQPGCQGVNLTRSYLMKIPTMYTL